MVDIVIDGNGDLVSDALVEAWQADAHGDYQADYDLKKPFNSVGRTAPRRQTLIAKREEVGSKVRYRLDIRLQGEGETVFFDF